MLSQAYKVTPSTPSSMYQQVGDVIDLEEPKVPESNTRNDVTSTIVVDSDDEDGNRHVQKMQPSSLDRFHDFRARLSSQMEERLKRNRLSAGAASSALQVSVEQAIATEGKRLPSIQYEKAVLRNVTEKQLASNLELVQNQRMVVRRERDGEALASVVDLKKNQRAKDSRGEGKGNDLNVQGNPLNVEGNMEKETAISSSPISSKDDKYYIPSTQTHQDDTKTPESDGLEDLWKDTSVAMKCSKANEGLNSLPLT